MFEPYFPANPYLGALVAAVDLLGLLVGFLLLRDRAGREPARSPWRDLWLGLLWVGLLAALGGGASRVLFGSLFGTLRVWTHVLTVVAAPLALWRGVAQLRRARLAGGAALAGIGIALLLGSAWAHFVEVHDLEITRQDFTTPRMAAFRAPIRAVILADIQTDAVGDYEREVFRRVDEARPDLLLLPGDFIQHRDPLRFAEERDALLRLFEGLEHPPRLGIWAVLGDVDFHPEMFEGTPIRLLRNEVAEVPGEPGLQIAGLTLGRSRVGLDDPVHAELRSRIADFPGFTIVLGHAPDAAQPILVGDLQTELLYVAGHTHGGQVVVPGFGPPITLSRVPRRVAAGGLFRFGNAGVLVSRGIGHERGHAPRIRMFCRPEMAVVDLASGKAPDEGSTESGR